MGKIGKGLALLGAVGIGWAACPTDGKNWDKKVDAAFDTVEGWLDDGKPVWPEDQQGAEQVASAEAPTQARSTERESATPAPVDRARTETRRLISADPDAIAALGEVRRRDIRQGDPVAQVTDMEGRGDLVRIEEGIENAIAGGRIAALPNLNYKLIVAFDAPGKPSGELTKVMGRVYKSQTAMLVDQYGLPHPVRQREGFVRALRSDEERTASLTSLIDVQSQLALRLKNGHANAWNRILKEVYGVGEESGI